MGSINPIVAAAQQVLLGSAVRQNHALEHATIVLLSKKYSDVRLAGVSSAVGFFVFGDVPTEAILPAATEALRLLRSTSRTGDTRTMWHEPGGDRHCDQPCGDDSSEDAAALWLVQ